MNSKLTFEARLKKHFTFGNKRCTRASAVNPVGNGRKFDRILPPAPVNLSLIELGESNKVLKNMSLWDVGACLRPVFTVSVPMPGGLPNGFKGDSPAFALLSIVFLRKLVAKSEYSSF
ncbi:hypothetical protein [Sulfidibacter corallicola]|uniref:Uncharacterized protein n=1 Tax=Sulfidibacter corallicola TaxID=2818388 RepID=A0A8A4TTY4_SULCO|nr:hypothetical protein [Sulfidibacter corallicola]QTD53426.1 hypothetical protein J3U87_13305 [Sulfidibacter corallicola]